MSIFGLSDQDAADLKTFYEDTRVDTMFKANPFLAMVDKPDTHGSAVSQTVKYGYGGAHGPDFATNYANLSNSMGKRKPFLVPWYEFSALDQIQERVAVLSENDSGAIVNIVADALEGTQRNASQDVELACFQDGFGVMATISSNTNPSGTTYVLTLTLISDAEKFQVGDRLVTAATAASAPTTGSFTVTKVDRDLGTIQGTAVASWTPTNGHVILLQASKPTATNTVANWMTGMAGWLPVTAPVLGTDSFFGVDRGDDPSALAGRRIVATGMPIKKAIRKGLSRLANAKHAMPDVVWVNPEVFGALQDDLQSAAVYDQTEGKGAAAGVFFKGIVMEGPKGPVKIHSSWACPADRVFITTMNTWHVHSPGGKIVRLGGKDKDGVIGLIAENGSQVRSWGLTTLTCDFPGANAVVSITAPV
jgi:hypothetical protein